MREILRMGSTEIGKSRVLLDIEVDEWEAQVWKKWMVRIRAKTEVAVKIIQEVEVIKILVTDTRTDLEVKVK